MTAKIRPLLRPLLGNLVDKLVDPDPYGPVGNPIIPPPVFQVFLRATFDQYTTPATPVTSGQVLAESGGDHQIEKGSMVVRTATAVELEDQRLKCGSGELKYSTVAGYTVELGLTIEVTIDQTAQEFSGNVISANRTDTTAAGIFLWSRSGSILRARAFNVTISANYTYAGGVHKVGIINGGFNVSGEPDPLGAYGRLFTFDDAIVTSEPNYNDAGHFNATFSGGASFQLEIDKAEVLVDASKVATPNRSLFAQEGPLSGYTPENGSAWAEIGTWVVTVGGRARASVLDGNNLAFATVVVGAQPRYLECSYSRGNTLADGAGMCIRTANANNNWTLEAVANNTLQIIERVGGVPSSRASSTSVTSQDGRLILTDGADNVLVGIQAKDGVVISTAPSTSLASEQSGGMFMNNSTLHEIEWFCTRGGS